MKTLRQLHLYLGCIFAPLIIYFSISGAWQVFRLNDVPKDQTPTAMQSFFHELSKPHTNSTLPGLSPKTERSVVFNWLAALMSIGMVITAALGLILAFRYSKSPKLLFVCVGAGVLVPVIFLVLH